MYCRRNTQLVSIFDTKQPATRYQTRADKKSTGSREAVLFPDAAEAYSTALTIASMTFLASPNTIIVFAW